MAFTHEDSYKKVTDMVAEKLSTDIDTVKKATNFESLGADSLDMVEIVMQLEEDFGIQIEDEEAEKLTGIDEVVNYIHARRTK